MRASQMVAHAGRIGAMGNRLKTLVVGVPLWESDNIRCRKILKEL